PHASWSGLQTVEEMLMPSRVSVIIPTYNGSAFIGEALESVWQQTRLPRGVIGGDDAATEGAPDLVRPLATHAAGPPPGMWPEGKEWWSSPTDECWHGGCHWRVRGHSRSR